jgi:hypothetical protein
MDMYLYLKLDVVRNIWYGFIELLKSMSANPRRSCGSKLYSMLTDRLTIEREAGYLKPY